MGGSPISAPLSPTVTSRIDRARQITEMQVQLAKNIATANFGMGTDPAIVGAIIQALATNYSATVQANSQ
jgi:hypothetical protein